MKIFFALFSMLLILSMLSGCAPALLIAANKGDINTVKNLLDNGADVNASDAGLTALMHASTKGRTDVVKLLIERGADVNMLDGYICALGWAAEKGHTDIMDILVAKGANIDIAIRQVEYTKKEMFLINVNQNGVDYLYKLKKNAELAKLKEFEIVARQYRESKPKPSLPEEVIKYKAQAEFAMQQKRFTDAIDLYANALNISPWWDEGHFNRGLLLGKSDISRYTEAIVEMKKYLLLAPNAPNARSAQNKIYQWESMIK